MLLFTRRASFLLGILSTLLIGGRVWSYQGQSKEDCKQRPDSCLPLTPKVTPKVTPTRKPPRPNPSPKLIEERGPGFVPLKYGQEIKSRINWLDKKTGAGKQSNGQFTLYNEYFFDSQKSDYLVIRLSLTTPTLSSKWVIQLVETTSKNIIPLKPTNKAPGEFSLADKLPNSGRYHVLVKYSDLDSTATSFAASYTLWVTMTSKVEPFRPELPKVEPVKAELPKVEPPKPKSPKVEPPEVYVQRCYDNLKANDLAKARDNCRKALEMNGTVTFEINSRSNCKKEIDANKLQDFDEATHKQLELRKGGLEIKKNGQPIKDCFSSDLLKDKKQLAVAPQSGNKIILDIRDGTKALYYFFPQSRSQEEARLISELIDTFYVRMR